MENKSWLIDVPYMPVVFFGPEEEAKKYAAKLKVPYKQLS